MLQQTDQLIMSAVSALEGRSESDMVRRLLEVRDNLQARRGAAGRTTAVDDVKTQALAAVNEYFERRLRDVPAIRAYIDEAVARA